MSEGLLAKDMPHLKTQVWDVSSSVYRMVCVLGEGSRTFQPGFRVYEFRLKVHGHGFRVWGVQGFETRASVGRAANLGQSKYVQVLEV